MSSVRADRWERPDPGGSPGSAGPRGPNAPRGRSGSSGSRRWRRHSRPLLALLAALILVPAGGVSADTGSPATAEEESQAPPVIPALQDWRPGSGSYEFGDDSRILLDGNDAQLRQTGQMLADELQQRYGHTVPVAAGVPSQRDGDVVLSLDDSRQELADEGYEMAVEDVVHITGATDTGVFYGTRTLLQALTVDAQVPQGETIDVPEYPERGITWALGPYSQDRFERLLEEMSYLKLNHLNLELRMDSESHPETVRWPYYPKDQIAEIVELAEQYHVTILPKVNAPGHMTAYLWDRPDLQLVDINGEKSDWHLDITNPEAVEFYLDLVDEWMEAVDSPYWHMGADEYMAFTSYADFPIIGEYAREQFGEDAEPGDAVIDFINTVHDHVASQGRELRIWNDGIPTEATLSLDSEIIVEYWHDDGFPIVPLEELIDDGHRVQNAASALYHNAGQRISGTDLCGEDPIQETTLTGCIADHLWDQGWDPSVFEGFDGEQLNPQDPEVITGAKLSFWHGVEMSEHEVQADLFMPLRFIAQRTWGETEPFISYSEFTDRANALGDPPGWDGFDEAPLADGTYTMRTGPGSRGAVGPAGAEPGSTLQVPDASAPWEFERTDDAYYTIVSADTGLCVHAELFSFTQDAVTTQECADITEQKWEILPVDRGRGYLLTSAASQLALVLGEDRETVVQVPPHLGRAPGDAWHFDPS